MTFVCFALGFFVGLRLFFLEQAVWEQGLDVYPKLS